jgi:hypothetical protein
MKAHERGCERLEGGHRRCNCGAIRRQIAICERLESLPPWQGSVVTYDERGNKHLRHPSGATAVVYVR